ncbi:excinuclease ABC subunit A [Patescibacteria group bacterium]|nr:MAG: excinuclease ABC subunit A [Patescibacteria group bacterium]
MKDNIIIKGAREHNLKNISLELPRNKMIVMTGLSGSGKSSLAFDTIFAEGQRRYVESLSAYARQFLGQMDKPDVDEIEGLSPAISIDQKAHSANPRSTVATITEIYDYLRVLFARIGQPHCVIDGREITKLTVEQMVDAIVRRTVEIHRTDETRSQTTDQITILAPVVRGRKGEYHQLLYDLLNAGFAEARIDGKFRSLRNRLVLSRYQQHTIELLVDRVPIGWPVEGNKSFRSRLAEALEVALDRGNDAVTVILDNGTELTMSSKYACPDDGFSFPEIEPRLFSFNSPYGACEYCHGLGLETIWSEKICPKCAGQRLRAEALAVTVGGKNIVQVTAMSVGEAADYFKKLKLSEVEREISEAILKEIVGRLKFMHDVGLDYLTLDRIAGTLSGGEAQRIRLASQIGSRLVGALYVLDEPTIGLHQRDNARLIETLEQLRELGNTIIVVEHDEETIAASDYLVDIGPGAGKLGGEIVVAGPTGKLLSGGGEPDIVGDPKKSLTLQYLRGEKSIAIPERRKLTREKIVIKGAAANNLKKIDVEIPLRRFVCLTGVSGSGKSSLMSDTIYPSLSNKLHGTRYKVGKHRLILGLEWLDKVIDIDQSPIGRTPRSNPATYTGAWTFVRELFSQTPDSRARGYKPGRFSFNIPGGRCENCEGNGLIAIEMHFLPTVYVTCDICRGKRFDRETLEIKYKGKSIHDILTMTIAEADRFFRDVPFIHDKLKILSEVGLDYLELGQSATTLSGGEAQRVKLGTELARRQTGRTLFLLDEPTVGLHFEDVKKLIEVLERLVSHGNTVLVIEHNLDVIKSADWVIDLGPEGGDKGGEVVATGTPEEIARRAGSYTGQYLKKILR